MLIDSLKKYRIVLASQSPRRHMLLKEAGIDFEVITKDGIDEIFPDNLKREEIPIYLAELKSKAFTEELTENTILITADTIVWLNNEVIGKPIDEADAISMIKKLSGKEHQVYSGVCIKSNKKQVVFSVCSNVKFRNLSDIEIKYYVENYKPFDKAGAYGIQEWIGYIGIEGITGSYFNVMGLPIQRLYVELEKFINE